MVTLTLTLTLVLADLAHQNQGTLWPSAPKAATGTFDLSHFPVVLLSVMYRRRNRFLRLAEVQANFG